MRPLDLGVKTTLAQPHYECLMLHIGGVTDYFLTTAPDNILDNGNTYLANGLLVLGSPIKEQADLKTDETQFTFADFNREFQDLLRAEGYLTRPVFAQMGIFNAAHIYVGAVPFFAGAVSNMQRVSLQNEKTTPLTISAQWLWAVGETPAGRNCTQGSQQGFFPSDQGMAFINDLGQEIPWGRE
jgi:hypothetical protein